MSSPLPIPVFVDHYASGPSGISTYGAHLANAIPELYQLNLHAVPSGPTSAYRLDVPSMRSHDAQHVAGLLVDILRRHPDRRMAWLPNVGDVSWAAAWRALMQMSPVERARVRLFGIVHGDQDSQYAAMRRYAPIIGGLAGVSRRCVERLSEEIPPGAPAVEFLPYPVPVPACHSVLGWTGPLRILYAGRFEESQKRVSRLPELFRQLARADIPFSATLAGDGPARESIAAEIAALPDGVASRIRFLGPVPQARMSDVLAAHDVLVLVSAFEGTPLVVLEAMSAGVCPVLMALPGGLPELLRDGDNACIVPQGRLDDMVAAIGALHHDRGRVGRLKAAARETIQARANPSTHAAQLLARLALLWERPAPDPHGVTEPDLLGRRVDELVRAVMAAPPVTLGVWGAGVVGRQIVDRLVAAGVTPVVMVDADPARHGSYRGIAVAPPSVLDTHTLDLICVGSIAFADEIVATLQRRPVPPRVLVP